MAPSPNPMDLLSRVRRDVERNAQRARNAVKLVTSNQAHAATSPRDTVWSHGRSQLWHYRSDQVRVSPPLLIVFSLFSKSYILDLSPGNSFIERLIQAGFDVFMVDWGIPDERDAQNRLEDYVDGYLPAVVARIQEVTGAEEINVLGYCFGGDLSLLYLAHHPDAPVRSLSVMATPVDFEQVGPLGDMFRVGGTEVSTVLNADGNLPPSVVLQGFRSLAPTAEITRYVNLWDKLWSDEYVASYQAMTGWGDDHIPLAGATAEQIATMLVRQNAMITDQLVLGGDAVHLSDITCPFLTVRASRDHIVPEAATAPLIDLVGSAEKDELVLDAGHVGLLVGRTAARTTIPTIIEFLHRRSDVTDPAGTDPADTDSANDRGTA
jgi:polyhydroxyalkanoate synthase subunit PhaC